MISSHAASGRGGAAIGRLIAHLIQRYVPPFLGPHTAAILCLTPAAIVLAWAWNDRRLARRDMRRNDAGAQRKRQAEWQGRTRPGGRR
jgi:hypothetical protein